MAVQIVLADDQAAMRAAIGTVLRAAGFELVAEAEDVDGLVAAALEHRPDVVLTDLQMPSGDGLEAARRIREELPAVGVIVLSQFADDRYAEAVRDLPGTGGSGYLLKEAVGDVRAFADAVRSVAAGGTPEP